MGKTTLLKILLGNLEPTSGKLKFGTRLEVAYFDQLRSQLELDKTVRDNIDRGSDRITVNGKSRHVISYLQDFLFSPERIHSRVSTLSGGERNRLMLAKLFLKPANVLVMDEPTNDLDIETLELLEELLLEYQGTLLLVSHDRSFLNHLVTSCIVFDGNAQVNEYVGGYDDWLRQKPEQETDENKQNKNVTSNVKKDIPDKKILKSVKLGYKQQRELDSLPETIEELESQIEELHTKMSDQEFYKQSAEIITETQNLLKTREKELEHAYERWAELES